MTADCSTQEDVSPENLNEDDPRAAEEDPEEVPEEAPEEDPEEAAEDTPEEAPEDTPEEAPEEVPEEGGQDQSVDEGEQHPCGEDSFDPGFHEGEGSLLLDSPESQDDASHEETEESSALTRDEGALNEQEYEELLEQLLEQRDEALNHSSQLQAKLPQYIKRNPRNFGGLDSDASSAEQLQMYKQNMKMLRDLKEQLVLEAQQAQQQMKELASRCGEKKNEVSHESV